MRGCSKPIAAQFEREITTALTTLFGPPTEDYPGAMLEWLAPAMGGNISFHLVRDSLKAGTAYRARTVFCRYNGMLERYGRNGKNNFHSSPSDPAWSTINSALHHIRSMLEEPDRARFDEIVHFQTMPDDDTETETRFPRTPGLAKVTARVIKTL